MYGLTPIITARDKNTNYFGSEILTTKRLRDEIPYRMASHGTLEDFTDQTGWTNGAACILPDGTPGREKSSATTGTTANKVYDSVLDVKEYIIFNAYLEAGSQPSIFLADSTNTNSFSFDLTYRMKGTGYQQIQVSRNDFSVSSGSPAWDNIQRIAFRTLSSGIIRMGKIETYSPRYALCTLWHDDGYESFYTKVYEYLKTKNMRAVSALIGEYIGESNFLDIPKIKEMMSYGMEFINHTYSHVNLTTLSLLQAEYEVAKGLETLLNLGAGKSAYYLSVPGSHTNDAVNAIFKKYATVCKLRTGLERIPVFEPMNLQRQLPEQTTPVSTITGWIDTAIANKLWLILVFHNIKDVPSDQYDYATANYNAVIDYLDTNSASIKTVTIGEALYYG